jgi:hypothetical protein
MQKKFTLLIALLFAWIAGLQAQDLYLKTKDGVVTIKSLETLKKFTFSNNNLLINYLSGPAETYSLSNISKLSFKSAVTGVDELSLSGTTAMKVYPNPVTDIIYIQNAPEVTYAVSIYRISGSLVLTTKLSSGTKSIDVSYLASGLYLLNVNGLTFKFVKL